MRENVSVMHELECTIIRVVKRFEPNEQEDIMRFDPVSAYHIVVDMEVMQNGTI